MTRPSHVDPEQYDEEPKCDHVWSAWSPFIGDHKNKVYRDCVKCTRAYEIRGYDKLSNFFLHASKGEKERVFMKAAEMSNEDQNRLLNKVQDNMRSAINPVFTGFHEDSTIDGLSARHEPSGLRPVPILCDDCRNCSHSSCSNYYCVKHFHRESDDLATAKGLVLAFVAVVCVLLVGMILFKVSEAM